MDQRLLTVLNEDGEPKEALESHEVHARGLLHRSIHILVVNDSNEVFVRRRPETKELYPGVWSSSVGSHVLADETPVQSAEKSLKIYLGLETPLEFVAEVPVRDAQENELIAYFTARSNSITDLNPSESSEGRFMNSDELLSLIASNQTTPHLATGFHLYQKTLSPL